MPTEFGRVTSTFVIICQLKKIIYNQNFGSTYYTVYLNYIVSGPVDSILDNKSVHSTLHKIFQLSNRIVVKGDDVTRNTFVTKFLQRIC